MMLKAKEADIPRLEDMRSCIWSFFTAACEYDEPCLVIPVVDKWRDPIPWQMWYDELHMTFRYTGIDIRVFSHYYLTSP